LWRIRVKGEIAVRFNRHERAAIGLQLRDDEVEVGVGVAHDGDLHRHAGGGVHGQARDLHGQAQVVAPDAGTRCRHVEHLNEGIAAEHEGCGVVVLRHPHDQGLRAAVQEELPHRIRHRAVAVKAAMAALEVREARDEHRLVGHAFPGVTDERSDRRGDACDVVTDHNHSLWLYTGVRSCPSWVSGRDRFSMDKAVSLWV